MPFLSFAFLLKKAYYLKERKVVNMKNIKSIITLSLVPVMLAGCSLPKKINEEQFREKYNETVTYLSSVDNVPSNIHIQNKAGATKYDYKEGEFYGYYNFALLILVPVTGGEYTWKEEGKFYHAEKNMFDNKKSYKKEITEEQFNTYMAGHKNKMLEELQMPLNMATILLNGGENYENIRNTYYSVGKTGWKLSSKAEYVSDNNKTYSYTIQFNNNLPVKYTSKGDSETVWKYSLGKAKLSVPSFDSTSESQA